MATQDILKSLIGSVTANPDFISQLANHPYSAVRESTGAEDVSRSEVSEALTALSALMGGANVNFDELGDIASGLLSQNDGSAHQLAQSLFGNMLGGQTSGATSMGIDPAQLANLASVSFEKGMAGVDLSDGLGIDDVIGFAKGVLGR